jgi:hypothetical protein
LLFFLIIIFEIVLDKTWNFTEIPLRGYSSVSCILNRGSEWIKTSFFERNFEKSDLKIWPSAINQRWKFIFMSTTAPSGSRVLEHWFYLKCVFSPYRLNENLWLFARITVGTRSMTTRFFLQNFDRTCSKIRKNPNFSRFSNLELIFLKNGLRQFILNLIWVGETCLLTFWWNIFYFEMFLIIENCGLVQPEVIFRYF